jgi:hypothetical protein
MRSKNIFLFFCLFLFCIIVKSQQTVPADGEAFYKKAMSSINTKHIAWIKSTSVNVKTRNIDEAGIRKLASGYGSQYNFNNMDIEALVALVMMQCAKDQEQDMKNMMKEIKKRNEEKQNLREAQQAMEQNKNAMSSQMLDSFKLLTTTKANTVIKTQTTRVQTVPTATKVNTPVVTKVSDVEIKEVQDAIKIKHDSISELNEAQILQMQRQMDKRSKLEDSISNIMRKIAETQNSIIQNLKSS